MTWQQQPTLPLVIHGFVCLSKITSRQRDNCNLHLRSMLFLSQKNFCVTFGYAMCLLQRHREKIHTHPSELFVRCFYLPPHAKVINPEPVIFTNDSFVPCRLKNKWTEFFNSVHFICDFLGARRVHLQRRGTDKNPF